MKKPWRTRDWIWAISYLILIISGLVVALFYDDQEIKQILNFSVIIITLVLSLVALFYTIIQNNSTNSVLQSIKDKVSSVYERIIVPEVNSKPSNVNQNEPNKSLDTFQYATRFHFKIHLSQKIDINKLKNHIYSYYSSTNTIVIDHSLLYTEHLEGNFLVNKVISVIDGYFLVDKTINNEKQDFENCISNFAKQYNIEFKILSNVTSNLILGYKYIS